jgi:crossover junction endodeoxyribonuclease RuvC
MLRYGAITTPAGIPLSKRLYQIGNDMESLIEQLHPDVISIEELFFNNNITTGIAVAHGRGVILFAAEKCGVPLFEYTPSQVKQAVVGYGRAEKHQVMEMTRRLLKLKAVPRPDDAADALALALCHARSCTSQLSQNPSAKETV